VVGLGLKVANSVVEHDALLANDMAATLAGKCLKLGIDTVDTFRSFANAFEQDIERFDETYKSLYEVPDHSAIVARAQAQVISELANVENGDHIVAQLGSRFDTEISAMARSEINGGVTHVATTSLVRGLHAIADTADLANATLSTVADAVDAGVSGVGFGLSVLSLANTIGKRVLRSDDVKDRGMAFQQAKAALDDVDQVYEDFCKMVSQLWSIYFPIVQGGSNELETQKATHVVAEMARAWKCHCVTGNLEARYQRHFDSAPKYSENRDLDFYRNPPPSGVYRTHKINTFDVYGEIMARILRKMGTPDDAPPGTDITPGGYYETRRAEVQTALGQDLRYAIDVELIAGGYESAPRECHERGSSFFDPWHPDARAYYELNPEKNDGFSGDWDP